MFYSPHSRFTRAVGLAGLWLALWGLNPAWGQEALPTEPAPKPTQDAGSAPAPEPTVQETPPTETDQEPQPARSRAEWAATASFILPGAGQVIINQEPWNGALQLGLYGAGWHVLGGAMSQPEYRLPENRVNTLNYTLVLNRTEMIADISSTFITTMEFYSAYDAYRTARLRVRNEGYNTPAPRESLQDLVRAPFRWEYLSRPTTFLMFIGPLYVLANPPAPNRYLTRLDPPLTRDEARAGYFGEMMMVSVGEEAFFRGVLNNGFSDSMGENMGLVMSSAVFGAVHAGNPQQATAGQAFLFGLYLGWLQQNNNYDIGEGVAIHFWWNVLVSWASLRDRPTQHVQIFSWGSTF
ncbi:MAG: CPBP family glutamic-type intramembrane protease [Deltaproteobacteria bacterium]|nr:CPBP family glutamic-type intramembrane protease [Deltaproteobacteria bacterium]